MGFFSVLASATNPLKVGDSPPDFSLKTHEGQTFALSERKGQWTVLYFYPKADTPGCTKQACAFRDSIKVLRDLGAEVFGVSSDDEKALAAFHKKHHLNFTLLADPDLKVIDSFGARMPLIKMAKRWTFVLDPNLKIVHRDDKVDPVKDADQMAEVIASLQKSR